VPAGAQEEEDVGALVVWEPGLFVGKAFTVAPEEGGRVVAHCTSREAAEAARRLLSGECAHMLEVLRSIKPHPDEVARDRMNETYDLGNYP